MAKLIVGENDIKTLFPKLIEEWDYSKNDKLPEMFTTGSHAKVWWFCNVCKQSWEATIANRVRGAGCPYCSGKVIKQGVNDLATLRPDIAAEWDFTHNNTDPSDYTYGSGQKAWWKCRRCGYVWTAKINNRTNGSGCPKCSRYTHTSFAEQVIYYYIKQCFDDAENGFKPSWLGKGEIDIFVPSVKLALEYDGEHWHKNEEDDVNKSDLIIGHGINLIRIREPGCPQLGAQYSIITTPVPKGTGVYLAPVLIKLFKMLREMGLLFANEPEVDIERDRQNILSQYAGSIEEKTFSAVCPELVKEWDYKRNGSLKPEYINAFSSQRVWWVCSNCGTEWSQIIASRTNGHGCPRCAENKRILSFRKSIIKQRGSFSALFPELLVEWDYSKNKIDPCSITSRTNISVWWICNTCGNEWEMSVAARVAGSGCPVCGHKKAVKSRIKTLLKQGDSFGDKNPDLVNELDVEKNDTSINPYSFTSHSKQKAWWKCPHCGFSWEATFSSRTSGHGCPVCSTEKRVTSYLEKILSDRGSLADEYPELMQEWDYSKNSIDPHKITSGNNTSVWWKCVKCGHEWKTSPGNRTNRKNPTGCPKCATVRNGVQSRTRNLVVGVNDLLSDNPELCEEWDYQQNQTLRPENCTKSSGQKVWWKCNVCHGTWQATIANRNMLHSKCPYCSNKKVLVGFNDLAHKYPEIAEEWSESNFPVLPNDVVYSSHRKVFWTCSKCGTIWESEVRSRTQFGAECPCCKKKTNGKTVSI